MSLQRTNTPSLSDSKLVVLDRITEEDHGASLVRVHADGDPNTQTNEAYFKAGHALFVVEPQLEGVRVGSPMFVWVKLYKRKSAGIVLEVYGNPSLFAPAESFEKALAVLNDTLVSTYEDLRDDDQVAGSVRVTQEFLRRVYEEPELVEA